MKQNGEAEIEESRFMYVNAASGTTYAIYKKAKNHLVICDTISDESSIKVICDYAVEKDLHTTRDYWREDMWLNWDDNQYDGKNYRYWHKTDSIDQGAFDKQERLLADDMKQVIISNVEGDWDDPILAKAEQQTSLAKFCADMIREMTVEEDPADSSAGEGDYCQVLEEYKDAFALAKSGNVDYDSKTNSMKYVLESFMLGVSNYIMMGSDSANLHLQYAEIDLNGDGTKELIVGCKDDNYDETAIDSIFTVDKDGKVERILSCDSVMFRAAIAIYDDRTIEYSGSGGADANVYRFYKLKPDKIKLDLVVELEQTGNSYTNNGKEMSENDFWDLVKEKEEKNKMKLSWKEM